MQAIAARTSTISIFGATNVKTVYPPRRGGAMVEGLECAFTLTFQEHAFTLVFTVPATVVVFDDAEKFVTVISGFRSCALAQVGICLNIHGFLDERPVLYWLLEKVEIDGGSSKFSCREAPPAQNPSAPSRVDPNQFWAVCANADHRPEPGEVVGDVLKSDKVFGGQQLLRAIMAYNNALLPQNSLDAPFFIGQGIEAIRQGFTVPSLVPLRGKAFLDSKRQSWAKLHLALNVKGSQEKGIVCVLIKQRDHPAHGGHPLGKNISFAVIFGAPVLWELIHRFYEFILEFNAGGSKGALRDAAPLPQVKYPQIDKNWLWTTLELGDEYRRPFDELFNQDAE